MTKYLQFLLASLFFLSCSTPEVPKIPVKDFYVLPEQTVIKLSPDGNYISFLRSREGVVNLYTQNIGTGTVYRVSRNDSLPVQDYSWVNDSVLVFSADTGRGLSPRLTAAGRSGGWLSFLTPPGGNARLVDGLPLSDSLIIAAYDPAGGETFNALRINLYTGTTETVGENNGSIIDWIADHKGAVRVAVASDGSNNAVMYRAGEKDEFTLLVTLPFTDMFQPIMFDFDNSRIIAASNTGRDKAAVVLYDPKVRKEVKTLFSHANVDVTNVMASYLKRKITGASYSGFMREYQFADKGFETMMVKVKEQLKNGEITIIDSDKNEEVFLIQYASGKTPPAFYIYRRSSNKLSMLEFSQSVLNADQMGETEEFTFPTGNGAMVHGYLTYPANTDRKNLPLLVMVHDGPWARDNFGYQPEVQLFANRGFAVLRLNYRGSTGYGKNFWKAGFKGWGTVIPEDIAFGVRSLVKKGIADSSRTVVFGRSFGGYAALISLANYPELYAAGISHSGFLNLFTYLNLIRNYGAGRFSSMIFEMVGHPEQDKNIVQHASPLYRIQDIRKPILIAYGGKDPFTPVADINYLTSELGLKTIPVELFLQQEEGRSFSLQKEREFITLLESYLTSMITE